MAESMPNSLCEFCDFFKLQVLDFNEQNSSSYEEKKLKYILDKLIVLLGNGEVTDSIPIAVARLLARNYPEIIEFNGEGNLVIFVPDYYLNAQKVRNDFNQ